MNRPSAWRAVLLIAGPLFAALAIVDPFREFLAQDDGWAYARSVRLLLETGTYRLDAWSAANMPVQVYLAGALAKVFGYSLTVLRLSTLLLLSAALAAFYALLRELSVERAPAAVSTLGLLATPLVLMLGFTFMSDVQFMAWMLIALWAYVRGIRRGSDTTVLVGALAAACAIGTRQFGMALLGALALAWAIPRHGKRPPLTRLVWAGAIPLAAAVWQLRAGLAAPNFTQAVRLQEQIEFLARPASLLAHETGWRIATVLQYLGLSMLPVFPLLAVAAFRHVAAARRGGANAGRRPGYTLMLAATTWAIAMAFSLTVSSVSGRDGTSVVLPLWWMLPNAFGAYPLVMNGLAIAGAAGSFLIVALLIGTMQRRRALRDVAPESVLIVATPLCLLALHLGYVQFNDTYLVGLVPFALILIACAAGDARPMRAALTASAVAAVSVIVALSLWMRISYDGQQAQWRAADRLVAAGVEPRCIGASLHWAEYHGAFDDWLAATHPDLDQTRGDPSVAGPRPFHPAFYAWLRGRNWNASYQVFLGPTAKPPNGWRLAEEIAVGGPLFGQRSIWIYRREDSRASDSSTCPP